MLPVKRYQATLIQRVNSLFVPTRWSVMSRRVLIPGLQSTRAGTTDKITIEKRARQIIRLLRIFKRACTGLCVYCNRSRFRLVNTSQTCKFRQITFLACQWWWCCPSKSTTRERYVWIVKRIAQKLRLKFTLQNLEFKIDTMSQN